MLSLFHCDCQVNSSGTQKKTVKDEYAVARKESSEYDNLTNGIPKIEINFEVNDDKETLSEEDRLRFDIHSISIFRSQYKYLSFTLI